MIIAHKNRGIWVWLFQNTMPAEISVTNAIRRYISMEASDFMPTDVTTSSPRPQINNFEESI